MRIQFLRWLGVAVVLAVYLTPDSGFAQSGWLKFRPGSGVTLESYKGDFKHLTGISFMTSVWFLSGEFKMARDLYFAVEVPFSHFDAKSEYDFTAENLLGNPYFGIRYEKETSGGIFRAGTRLPLISPESTKDYAMYYGMMTTLDRFESFVPELFTLSAVGGYKYMSPDGIAIRGLLGPVLFMPKGEDKELWADYAVHLWYQNEAVTVGGGVAGRFLAAAPYADHIDFGERFANRLELAGRVSLGVLSPGLHLQIPLDSDQREEIRSSYGLDLTVAF
ncbi:hypothetical protein TRIP_C80015 [Candidatus Zixiibacteriota bacterium]|nr:hypothetical protein TRIP_C80015 [candidate division Zixibacteria bacterium]